MAARAVIAKLQPFWKFEHYTPLDEHSGASDFMTFQTRSQSSRITILSAVTMMPMTSTAHISAATSGRPCKTMAAHWGDA